MDDFTAKIAVNVVTEIFKESLRGGKWLSSMLSNKGKTADILGKAARTYRSNLAERYDVMRIFGMAKPIPLRNIYTRVNILEKITSRQHNSIDDLLEIFEIHQRRFGLVNVTKPGIEAVNEFEKFIILGKPGSGKTTFLKHILLETLAGRLARRRVPIFVSLKDLSDSTMQLFERMVREFEISGVPSASIFLEGLLEDGKCTLLLDGLDEASEDRRKTIIREIKEMSEQYHDNQYIVSCRIAAYNHEFPQFIDVEIADFGEEEIHTFVDNWFLNDPTKARACWEALQDSSQLKELASTPLLLAMLCLAYDETMDFASNRAEIYKESIEALLKKWDKSRGISRGQIYRNFTSKRKEEMLSAIAAETFDKEEYFLPRERIVSLIRSFISHLPEVRDHEEEEDAQAILTSIEEQHGLIVERALGIFSFSHLTFQEYFTASYVVSAGRESQRNLIRLHFEDVRWREVIILVGNLLPVADDYIIVALDKMAEIGFNGKYRDMLKEDLRSSDAGRSGKIEEKTIRVNDPQRGRYLTLVRGWGNALDIQEVREFLVEWRNGVKILSPIENFEIRSIAEQTAGKALHDFLKMSSAKASKEDSDLMEILQGMDKLFSAMANICMRIDEGRVKFHLNGYSSIEAVMKILLDGVGRDGFPWESRIGQIAAKISAKKKKKYFDVSRVSRSLEDLRKDSILRSFERRLARTIHFLSEGYNEQYREIQLLAAAETMFALISCPIYIRRETRQAALLTIFAKGSPMGSELA